MRVSQDTMKKISKFYKKNYKAINIIGAVTLVGMASLLITRAAPFTASIEPESGVISGNARLSGGAVKFGNTAPATGTLNLPRVPWEGGPAFYSKYSKTRGTEWESPNFFPIGYWGAYVNEKQRIQTDKDHGINVFHEIYAVDNANSSRWMKEVGMWNMSWDPGDRNGTEIIGDSYYDEIDMWAGKGFAGWNPDMVGFQYDEVDLCIPDPPRACGYTVMNEMKKDKPDSSGKIEYANFGKGALMWHDDADLEIWVNGKHSKDSRATWNLGTATADIYFYSDGNIGGEAVNFLGVPDGQVRRAGNYGEILMTKMRRASGTGNNGSPRIPLGVVIELAGQSNNNTISANQIEGAVWSSIIHEARTITYFSHSHRPGNVAQPGSNDILNDTRSDYTENRARVKTVNARIKQLAPVINTQSYNYNESNGDSKFNPGLRTMLKEQGGSFYIFAMQKRSATTSGTYTYTLPAGMPTTGTVEVMFENRTLPISGGKFTDSFAAEYTNHIYKITP